MAVLGPSSRHSLFILYLFIYPFIQQSFWFLSDRLCGGICSLGPRFGGGARAPSSKELPAMGEAEWPAQRAAGRRDLVAPDPAQAPTRSRTHTCTRKTQP